MTGSSNRSRKSEESPRTLRIQDTMRMPLPLSPRRQRRGQELKQQQTKNEFARKSKGEEALDKLRQRTSARPQYLIRGFFHSIDDDRSSGIEQEELSRALHQLNYNVCEEDCAYIFKQLDSNKNGLISMKEFLAGMNHIEEEIRGPVRILPLEGSKPQVNDHIGATKAFERLNQVENKHLERLDVGYDGLRQHVELESVENKKIMANLDELRQKLPPNEIKLKELWRSHLDRENQSYTSTTRLKTFLQEFGCCTASIATQLVRLCDPNVDGKVQFPQLRAVFGCIKHPENLSTLDLFQKRTRSSESRAVIKAARPQVVPADSNRILKQVRAQVSYPRPPIVKREYKDTRSLIQPMPGTPSSARLTASEYYALKTVTIPTPRRTGPMVRIRT